MLSNKSVIFSYETGPINWMFIRHGSELRWKKTENILQEGIPRKILKQKDSFGAFWYILINYKNGSRTPKKRKSVKKLKTLMPGLFSTENTLDWCFSTRASVATVLTTHPRVSRCLRVNIYQKRELHKINNTLTSGVTLVTIGYDLEKVQAELKKIISGLRTKFQAIFGRI